MKKEKSEDYMLQIEAIKIDVYKMATKFGPSVVICLIFSFVMWMMKESSDAKNEKMIEALNARIDIMASDYKRDIKDIQEKYITCEKERSSLMAKVEAISAQRIKSVR